MVRAEGPSSYEQIISALEALRTDPGYDSRFKILVDAREIDYSASMPEVRQMVAALGASKASFSRSLAVVIEPGPQFDLAELFARLAAGEGFTLSCFGAMQPALDWCSSRDV